MDEIGVLLDAARANAGLTQRQLARLCGLHQSTIARVERRGTSLPISTLARALEPLGLRPRVVLEPLDSITDAEIDRLLDMPPGDRLGSHAQWKTLATEMGGLRFLVGGAAAARLHGAPVPVAAIELVLREADLDQWAGVLARLWAQRWNAVDQNYVGCASCDPREPGPQRWYTRAGELSASYRDDLPEGSGVEVDGVSIEVVPMHEMLGDPSLLRVLGRVRQRIASRS